MTFTKFAQYLQRLEDTPKRLEITSILEEMIKELDPEETDQAIYLSLGSLSSQFNSIKFNIADKMMVKILCEVFNKTPEEIKHKYSESGDLGSVAQSLSTNSAFKLTINDVYKKLLEIAQTDGTGSQEIKIRKSMELMKMANPLSAKFIARIILGTTRLGFTELTIIDALAKHIGAEDKNPKDLKMQIEAKYRVHPDIGLIAKNVKALGLKGLEKIDIEVGVPVHAQKAQRMEDTKEMIVKMEEVWLEYKFDGTRVQLHMDRNRKMTIAEFSQQDLFNVSQEIAFTKTFTRNLEETTHQFPDIIEAAQKQINATSVILDGEAIGFNKETGEFLPFQETIQRKRKHNVMNIAKEIPLKLMVFDILYLDGKSLVNEPLIKRRELLEKVILDGEIIKIDEHIQTKSAEEITKFHEDAMEKGLEGIMIKKVNSKYEAGARNYSWVKFKKTEEKLLEDTVDCVILGYYFGKGDRAKFGIGKFLTAVWDENDGKFKTITKVGSGLTDEGWHNLKSKLEKHVVKEKPSNVDVSPMYNCEVWVNPSVVIEIAAEEISKSAEHTAKYALRFPRMIGYREDKSPFDTTTIKELEDMYLRQ